MKSNQPGSGINHYKALMKQARKARTRALSPYSGFPVGAALETASGRIYLGCNIESSSYGLTLCAERVALFKALSEGEKKFSRIAIMAGTGKPTPPCGACRQVLWDFAPDLEVIIGNQNGKIEVRKLTELLPNGFDRRYFKRKRKK